jgi:cytochrome c oxidase subunit 1
MVGGALTAYLAALHYWFPKVVGKMYPERLAFPSSLLIFAGFLLTFVPQFLLGNRGMPRRYANYPEAMQALHAISTVGSWALLVGLSTTLGYVIWALVYGKPAADNPWWSASYEWYVPSPPPKHNWEGSPRFERGPYDYTQSAPDPRGRVDSDEPPSSARQVPEEVIGA